MAFDMSFEEFLEKTNCSINQWESIGLDWQNFIAIAQDHDSRLHALALNAGSIANRLQVFKGVHSVRWRVKDTFGLLKKILRKNLGGTVKEKWAGVTVSNYKEVVTDLIGVRALHLLKEDCADIDSQIRQTWDVYDVVMFKKEGEISSPVMIERGAIEDLHNFGYRSTHYSMAYTAEKTPTIVEIQVRTIFQEGWSEIDHKVRYPDFSNNHTLKYFLGLFNGLAGTADEMGSFVIKLDELVRSVTDNNDINQTVITSQNKEIDFLQRENEDLKSKIAKQNKTTEIEDIPKSITTNSSGVNSVFLESVVASVKIGKTQESMRTFENTFAADSERMRLRLQAVSNSSKQLKSLFSTVNPNIEYFKTVVSPFTAIAECVSTISLKSENKEKYDNLITTESKYPSMTVGPNRPERKE